MKQIEALNHVAHNGGRLYQHSGWRGHKYLYCGLHATTIGMPILERLLVLGDLELVEETVTPGYSAVLTEQGKARLTVP